MELPRLEPLWQKYRDQGFTVIAIESQRDRERAEEFIAEHQLTYLLLENPEGEAEVVEQIFGVQGFPTSYLVDREGRILYAHHGFEVGDEVQLEAEIQELLAG